MDNRPLFPLDRGAILTQPYGANVKFYAEHFQSIKAGHNGMDHILRHGAPIYAPENGVAFKVYNLAHGSVTKGFGVCVVGDPDADGFCHVWVFWHTMSNIQVKEGDRVKKGQVLAFMGASGAVFTVNEDGEFVAVSDDQKGMPPKYPGTHLHTGFMLVLRTKNPKTWCLADIKGSQYRDPDGFVYEIQNYDNGNAGYIDPMKLDLQFRDEWLAQMAAEAAAIVPKIPEQATPEQKNKVIEGVLAILNAILSMLFKGR